MSPDTNHNDRLPDNNTKELRVHQVSESSAELSPRDPAELRPHDLLPQVEESTQLPPTNGLNLKGLLTMQVVKGGGTASEVSREMVSARAAVGDRDEEEEKIQEYLQRSDTAVIYPEPVGLFRNVPALTNGIAGDGEDASAEHFIKCPHCQKGCPSFQTLKEHIEATHPHAVPEEAASVPPSQTPVRSESPPAAALAGVGGPFGCSQCTTSFGSKDQLEKHELLHSPNAQVSCKVCHKTFANVYRLQRHMISHDESAILRKFKCTECEKAFKFKHHLKEHIRIHSGEKPFECTNCGKRFSHSGSYSSHMTSKKCLVMNLKMGRNRSSLGAPSLLDKPTSQPGRMPKRPSSSALNNNLATSPNHNSYLPIRPKYSEAAAAFLSAMAPRDSPYPGGPPGALPSSPGAALHPFYMTAPGLHHLAASGHPISPYSMPASLGQLLEQLQAGSPPHRPLIPDAKHIDDDLQARRSPDSKPHEQDDKSTECGELVMDTDEVDVKDEKESIAPASRSPGLGSNSGDLEAVKRILETVNASVTKQFLHANMQKLSADSPNSDCRSVASPLSVVDNSGTPADQNDHNCEGSVDVKSEGLAAKLEEAVHVKNEEMTNGSMSGVEDEHDSDAQKRHLDKMNEEYDMDNESVTTTDQVSEDGRKVRVRSLIADEQLTILKDHYANNPRPKREELARIAERIGFPVRVVQVWFQNTRARDRREGRLVQIPYSPIPPASLASCFPQTIVPSAAPHVALRTLPYDQGTQHFSTHSNSEQPLDLSTKKGTMSAASSPSCSPQRPPSAIAHSDSGEEAVNLSHKSSRSPTPFLQLPYQTTPYQSSNCSSDFHRSPSPVHPDSYSNSSRLARILAQPAHRLAMAGVSSAMGLVPMERFLQYNSELNASRSPLLNTSSSSPNSEKRSWKIEDADDPRVAQDFYPMEDDCSSKRSKVSQLAVKSLNSMLLPATPETEIEGQFICDQCDKAFSKQSSLARHKYEHSGQRPHKCDECPKAFKHKHHLTEHKRLHSGEKPFQCTKCLKRFSHSGSYSQHMNHRYSYCKPYRE